MAIQDKQMIRDAGGNVIAQVWNVLTDTFLPRLGNSKGAYTVSPPLASNNVSKNVTASVQLLPSDANRVRFDIQNKHATANLALCWGQGVTQGSVNNLILKPGEIYRGGADTELIAAAAEDGTTTIPVYARWW